MTIKETELDQRLVKLDRQTYQQFVQVLDEPPGGAGFERLMNLAKPWQQDQSTVESSRQDDS
jgi:uncharacterized protein (DUF1778 family)